MSCWCIPSSVVVMVALRNNIIYLETVIVCIYYVYYMQVHKCFCVLYTSILICIL